MEAAGRGLGSRLLEAAEALARGAGTGPRRRTKRAARGAVPFYAARGWRVVDRAPSQLPGGLALPATRMVKDAGQAGGPREAAPRAGRSVYRSRR